MKLKANIRRNRQGDKRKEKERWSEECSTCFPSTLIILSQCGHWTDMPPLIPLLTFFPPIFSPSAATSLLSVSLKLTVSHGFTSQTSKRMVNLSLNILKISVWTHTGTSGISRSVGQSKSLVQTDLSQQLVRCCHQIQEDESYLSSSTIIKSNVLIQLYYATGWQHKNSLNVFICMFWGTHKKLFIAFCKWTVSSETWNCKLKQFPYGD